MILFFFVYLFYLQFIFILLFFKQVGGSVWNFRGVYFSLMRVRTEPLQMPLAPATGHRPPVVRPRSAGGAPSRLASAAGQTAATARSPRLSTISFRTGSPLEPWKPKTPCSTVSTTTPASGDLAGGYSPISHPG